MRVRRSRKSVAVLTGGALSISLIVAGAAVTTASAATAKVTAPAKKTADCQLANGVKHVIYIQFDNVHYTRDNPNVPSDLQQMPSLLNFTTGNGTMISHEHTPLIAHTADDIVTSETGLYPGGPGLRREFSRRDLRQQSGQRQPGRGLLHGLVHPLRQGQRGLRGQPPGARPAAGRASRVQGIPGGINKSNTLFVVTADEGDHFVGDAPSPASCNGVTVQCTYKNVGEVDGNLTGMLSAKGVTTPFDVAQDSAPIIYAHGQPSRTTASVRALEQAAARLTADDVATGKTVRAINYEADPVELKNLHMITGDPRRTPTVALFGNTDFWYSSAAQYDGNVPASCDSSLFCQPSGQDAWNHGDVAPEINTTFLGLVGPGVEHQGVNNVVWSDHTDIVPTMWELLGLRGDYAPDGRVLAEVIRPSALPEAVRSSEVLVVRLAKLYKQLNAPVGEFGLDTLKVSTAALASRSSNDKVYNQLEADLTRLGAARDSVASDIQWQLLGAEFGHRPVSPRQARALLAAGNAILAGAGFLSAHS